MGDACIGSVEQFEGVFGVAEDCAFEVLADGEQPRLIDGNFDAVLLGGSGEGEAARLLFETSSRRSVFRSAITYLLCESTSPGFASITT